MKKALIVFFVLALSLTAGVLMAQQATTAPAAPAAPATPAAAGLTIERMELAGAIEDRKPVDVADAFPSTREKVYCYVELKDVPQDTSITFAWSFGQNDMGKVTQQVKKSARWRTWSSKVLGGMKGDWKVDVLDPSGAVLKTAAFKVQ